MAAERRRIPVVAMALAGLVALAGLTYIVQRVSGAGGMEAAVGAKGLPSAPRGAGVTGAGGKDSSKDVSKGADPVAVEAIRLIPERFVDEATAVGSLRSAESVVLRPEISGRLARILFREGELVERGTLLMTLDASVQEAELQQAKANLALAQANQRRNEDLFQRHFVSEQALDNTRAALKIQEAAVALAQARLAKTRIEAPFRGVVGIRAVSVGDYLKEGQDLVNLEDIATLKVDFRLPEVFLERLQKGLPLELTSDTLPGQTFPARLDAVNPLVDQDGRAVMSRAVLSNPEGRLRPGMFARVRLVFSTRDNVLMLPEQAVVTGGKTRVFVVREGRAVAVPVRLGVRRAGKVEVLEGLAAGDVVVTAGQLKLQDGTPVQVPDDLAAQAG